MLSTCCSRASSEIAPYIARLETLRDRAAEADTEDVREGLRQALLAVYENRRIDFTVRVTVDVSVFSKTVTRRVNQDVISPSEADAILAAADNIHRIGESDAIRLDQELLVEALPTRELIDTARDEVATGLTEIPDIEAIYYTVADGTYSASVLLGTGQRYDVSFNVLDVEAAIAGVEDVLAEYALSQSSGG